MKKNMKKLLSCFCISFGLIISACGKPQEQAESSILELRKPKNYEILQLPMLNKGYFITADKKSAVPFKIKLELGHFETFLKAFLESKDHAVKMGEVDINRGQSVKNIYLTGIEAYDLHGYPVNLSCYFSCAQEHIEERAKLIDALQSHHIVLRMKAEGEKMEFLFFLRENYLDNSHDHQNDGWRIKGKWIRSSYLGLRTTTYDTHVYYSKKVSRVISSLSKMAQKAKKMQEYLDWLVPEKVNYENYDLAIENLKKFVSDVEKPGIEINEATINQIRTEIIMTRVRYAKLR